MFFDPPHWWGIVDDVLLSIYNFVTLLFDLI